MKGRNWVIQLLCGAALAGLASGARGQGPAAGRTAAAPKSPPVALVNGEAITQADLDGLLRMRGPMPVQTTEAQKRQAHMQALGLLIDNLLMHQFLVKYGPPIPPDEVARKMGELQEGLQRQGKTLADYCNESNQTEQDVRDDIGHHLQWLAYARTQITDEEVQRYYAQYRDFFDKVEVRASHIVLRLPAGTPPAERERARQKLMALRAQIVAGTLDFAGAARQYSQCASAPAGGDLGFFPRRYIFSEPFLKAAFAMKVGEVSDLVETEYGYHLIKVTDRKPGQPSDFTKIKDVVREFRSEDLWQARLADQRKGARIEVKLPQ